MELLSRTHTVKEEHEFVFMFQSRQLTLEFIAYISCLLECLWIAAEPSMEKRKISENLLHIGVFGDSRL